MSTTVSPSYKRSRSYWEPVFAPNEVVKEYRVFDWDWHIKGFEHGHCGAAALKAKVTGDRFTVKQNRFSSCDFKGDFSFCKLTFVDCIFELCDFEDSIWKLAKFTGCKFLKCSFSTARFEDVQFIDCKWQDIGMSSGEMHLKGVLITNPEDFVHAAYTNLDKDTLAQNSTTPEHQRYRLEGTKAKVARTILSNLQGLYDDRAYYRAVKTYACQTLTARIAESNYSAKHESSTLRKIFYVAAAGALRLELSVLAASGRVNEWGRSIGRALLVGLAVVLSFWFIYTILGAHSPNSNLLASIEITLLFGYTKYASTANNLYLQIVECVNAFFGLWWYAVLVPTIVNRISRVHG